MGKQTGQRDQKKIQTRRLILKCANQMFRTKGYSSTRLEDIAAMAGVHKQTVLRHFGSKEEIALAFRQVALENFRKGLLDPERKGTVLDYWDKFIADSAEQVSQRGDMLRYHQIADTEPRLMAATMAILMEYEELLTAALSKESGSDPEFDLYSRLLAAFLVAGNYTIARHLLRRGELQHYAKTASAVVDFARRRFPSRTSGEFSLHPQQNETLNTGVTG